MERFGSQWVATCRHLAGAQRRLAGRGLLGRRLARLPAGGTELTGHRDYAPGDDYRQIDWHLAARHDELLTRLYEGETDLRAYFLLDASRSMTLGDPPKFELARHIVAALAYVALDGLQRVAVTTFAEQLIDDMPALGQRDQYPRVIDFLNRCEAAGGGSDLRRAAEQFVRRDQRRGLAVVVSDLFDPDGFGPGIDLLRYHGYEVRILQLVDPADAEPAELGDLSIVDVEEETALEVTVTERFRVEYVALVKRFHESVRRFCDARALPCVQIPVDWPRDEVLLAAIGARGNPAKGSP